MNFNIDIVFIITHHILLKHNNYIYQNIKNNNYFIEIMIYDYSDPLNNIKNYYFTLQKILKIAILRKYKNIMVLQSDILLKNDWINSLNTIINNELGVINNNFSIIWLQSEQQYFTDFQLNEINNKQYYRFNLIDSKNDKMTLTYGNDGLIISDKIYIKLYNQIKEKINSVNIEDINTIISYSCINTDSFIIYPNLIINIKKIEPLYNTVYNILLTKKKNYIESNNYKYLNLALKDLLIKNNDITLINNLNIDYINNFYKLKELINQDIINDINDEELIRVYNDYIIPCKLLTSIYNPNHFNIYYNFNKEPLDHFDWLFYKYYYDDLINNDIINNYQDAIYHYLNFGYKEHRFICIEEYLYDKNDNELEQNIKLLNTELFYKDNKTEIDERNLLQYPILYYIKYLYNHINII